MLLMDCFGLIVSPTPISRSRGLKLLQIKVENTT